MKNNCFLYFFGILLVVTSCSNEKPTKSKTLQNPILSEEAIYQSVQRDTAAVFEKMTTLSIKEVVLPSPEDLEIDFMPPPPEPPEPEPVPEPEFFYEEKTIEELWQEVTRLSKKTARWEDREFCFNYGDTLVKMKRYKTAIDAYKKAEEIGYRHLDRVYFKIARIYALQNKGYYSIDNALEEAKYKGFDDYKALLYDEAFEEYRKWDKFSYSYNKLFKYNKKAMFEAFIAFAPKKELTTNYTIDPINLFEDIEARNATFDAYQEKHPVIYSYFDAFAKEADYNPFSRGGYDNCRYEMCLTSEQYVAVIYSVEKRSEYIFPKKYKLVTYDWQGNIIAELEIAKRGSLKECKGFILRPDNSLVVTTYAVKWKNSARKLWRQERLANYKHLRKTVAKTEKAYQLTKAGELLEIETLLGMSLSYSKNNASN